MIYTLQTDREYIEERITVLNAIKQCYPEETSSIIDEEIKYMEHTLMANESLPIGRCIAFN